MNNQISTFRKILVGRMKRKLFVSALFALTTTVCFGQKQLLGYDDLKFLLHNNLMQADTFMQAKGYTLATKNSKPNNRSYNAPFQGGTQSDVNIRSDGKKLFIEIETNELSQYDLIRSSISQYTRKTSQIGDVQNYDVKDLGDIYITVNDPVPYDALRKDYDIHIVADKHITAYN